MRKILDYVDEHGAVDDDSVMYYTIALDRGTTPTSGPYPFTLEEFREYQDYLWKTAGGWDNCHAFAVEGAFFETYHVPFTDSGKEYVLNIMYGQGAAWTIFTKAEHDAYKARVSELDRQDKDEDSTLSD